MTVKELLAALAEASGIESYPEVFPWLATDHLRYLGDSRLEPEAVARVLTESGRRGPATNAATIYAERGELPALRAVADAETNARESLRWQREVEARLGRVAARASLCDREGVLCPYLTWTKRMGQVATEVSAIWAENPAAQSSLLDDFQAEMERALRDSRQQQLERLGKLREKLDGRRDLLDADELLQATRWAEDAVRLMEAGDLLVGARRIGKLEELLRGGPIHAAAQASRLPKARRNPLGRTAFRFEHICEAARRGADAVQSQNLREVLPDEALAETADPNGFLARHALRRTPDWSPYFGAMREWLGLQLETPRRKRKLEPLRLPGLEPRGASLPGRWMFVAAEPWQGAPFLEDSAGRPRIIAIVRLAVHPDAELRSVLEHVRQTVQHNILAATPESVDDQRFRDEGLVIVLLPGEALSNRRYDQFHRQVQIDGTIAGRVAYIDDLDLVRLLPVPAADRFEALQQLVLPRFPDALSRTYQSSSAVRPRMFFGRNDELVRLENGASVVFSGRKMGKSSLLLRLRERCSPETNRRAVLVGCSGIRRSTELLREIERELLRLVHIEAPDLTWSGSRAFPDDPEQAKERFRLLLEHALGALEKRVQIYFLLDEADNFIGAELRETSAGRDPRATISWFLRDLETSTHRGRLRFIFAGYDQVGRIFRDPGLGHSAFGNWGEPPLKLRALNEADARALITQPLAALGILIGDDLVERVLDYTSGHASLIQSFCRKLAERKREAHAEWPLVDVAVEFDDLQAVADDQRVTSDNYRQNLEATLNLNLDIARAYPLKMLFLALVSPQGLGCGRLLGAGAFAFEQALDQLRLPDQQLPDVGETLVLESLTLLAQLGLLAETPSDDGTRRFAFNARHYVNVLRTKSDFRGQLLGSVDEWRRRRTTDIEPRYVWTLHDSDLRVLREQRLGRPAVVVGLPGSGRGHLATLVASPVRGGPEPVLLSPATAASSLHEHLATAIPERLLVVADPDDVLPWERVETWLIDAAKKGLDLRWIGGPSMAWNLSRPSDVWTLIDGPYGIGVLTGAELESWAARPREHAPTAAIVPEADRASILRVTTGLLPVLEIFRGWLEQQPEGFPDPLRAVHAEAFLASLHDGGSTAAARRLATAMPLVLRRGVAQLFEVAAEWATEDWFRSDLLAVIPETPAGHDWDRILEAAGWLELAPTRGGKIHVPFASALGLILRSPAFAA